MSATIEQIVAGYLRANATSLGNMLEGMTDPASSGGIEALATVIENGDVISNDTIDAPDPIHLLDDAIAAFVQQADVGVLEAWALGIELRVNGENIVAAVGDKRDTSPPHAVGILTLALRAIGNSGTWL